LHPLFVGEVSEVDVGKSLDAARASWENASNKLQTGRGNLIRQAEQLKTLGAKAAKSLPNTLLEKADEET